MTKQKTEIGLPPFPKKERPIQLATFPVENQEPTATEAKKSYSDLLKHPKWQRKRLEVFNRDNFTCRHCKDGESTLHVHHLSYKAGKNPWEYEISNFITLCEHCHKFIEEIKATEPDINFAKPMGFKRLKAKGFFVCTKVKDGVILMTFKEDNTIEHYLNISSSTLKSILPIIKSAIKDGAA